MQKEYEELLMVLYQKENTFDIEPVCKVRGSQDPDVHCISTPLFTQPQTVSLLICLSADMAFKCPSKQSRKTQLLRKIKISNST